MKGREGGKKTNEPAARCSGMRRAWTRRTAATRELCTLGRVLEPQGTSVRSAENGPTTSILQGCPENERLKNAMPTPSCGKWLTGKGGRGGQSLRTKPQADL